MTTVFLKILNMSLTASLLILAVLPIRLLMKKAPKWTTCLLWLIVAVALVAPVRLESRASVLPTADPIVITSEKPQTNDTLPLYQEEPILIQDIIEQDPLPAKPNYIEIGGIVWSIGMAALLVYAAFSWLRLKRRVAASIEIDNHIFVCDDIDTPFILGIIRPRIYLPSALDEATTKQVLVHEQAHLARKDHWWKPLGYLLLTLHWFNPLVWAAYTLLCTDIELACDEKVIKNLDTVSKKAYSEALLNCSMPRRMIAACPLAFGEVGVKQRIKAVLHYKKPAFWVILIAIVVCAALCMGFLTNPVVKTLGELNNHRRDQFDTVVIGNSERYVTFDTNLSELFDVLEQVEIHPVELNTQPVDRVIALSSDNMDWSAYLNFSADYSYLWISYDTSLSHKDFAPGTQNIWNPQGYEVLNPDILQNIDPSEFSPSSPNSTPDSGIKHPTEFVKSAIETALNTASFNASNAGFNDAFSKFDTFHCTAFMTYVTKSGVISHKEPISITIKYKDSLFAVEEVEGESEIEAFLLTQDPITVIISQSNGTATAEFQGNVILNPTTGEILSITSYPVEQGSDIVLPFAIYPDMDESFLGYEALYDAIKSSSELNTEKWTKLVLIGAKSYHDLEYAVIGHTRMPYELCVLLEYQTNPDGTVSILNYDEGRPGASMGNYGYDMNLASFGRSLYWTTFGDLRSATTTDGTETDPTKTVATDYTGFRFIWPDLHQEDYPVEGNFFLAEVDSVIPPAIAIPMVGDNALTALGWRLP